MLGGAFALEVKLDVVQGIAYFLERGILVETGIACCQIVADVAQTPPLALLRILWAAECLANHFYQVVQSLIGLVLPDQRLYLAVAQPETLLVVEQVEGLGIQLLVLQIVFEVDVPSHSHAHETARSGGVNQWFHLVGSCYERCVSAELLDAYIKLLSLR